MLCHASLSECTDAGLTGTHLALFNCLMKFRFCDNGDMLTFALIVEIPFLRELMIDCIWGSLAKLIFNISYLSFPIMLH